jgi:hypothetical protein
VQRLALVKRLFQRIEHEAAIQAHGTPAPISIGELAELLLVARFSQIEG